MNIEALKSDLIRDEGLRPYVYQDSRGIWTCGVGFNVDRERGGGIPMEVIDFWLDTLLTRLCKQLDLSLAWWDRLDDVRQRVLANMAYNLGMGGLLEFRKMLMAVAAENYSLAADEMANSLWAKQVPQRAGRLIAAMRTGTS